MDEEELNSLIKREGWYMVVRLRDQKREYYYARKRLKGKGPIIETYLAPLNQLGGVTEEMIKEKLSKKRQNQCA